MANLEVLNGTKAGRRFPLKSSETILGRYPFCDVVLAEQNVSRQHTRIVRANDRFYVEDMNSLNGTFVNGDRIEKRTELNDQDRIRVYEVLIIFHARDDESQKASRSDTKIEDVRDTAKDTDPTGDGTDVAETQEYDDSTSIVNALDVASGPSVDAYSREKLKAVLEITRLLGSTLDMDEVLPTTLDALFDLFPQSDRGYVLFAEGPEHNLRLRAEKMKSEMGTVVSSTLGPISRGLTERVMSRGQAILSADAFADDEIEVHDSVLDFPFRSMMCAPLIGPLRKPLGIIYLDTNDNSNRFDDEDLEVLVSVATVAGQAVEYARAHKANLELDRRERELTMAKEVQLHFLPQQRPSVPDYGFFDYYCPAEQVGGDYHGYISLPDGRLAIAVGDVSGKGVYAALLMARLCSDVRYCLATSDSPADAVNRLNRELSEPSREECFVTFSLAVLDPREHTVTVVNAGHMPPIRRHSETRSVEELGYDEGGPPLGCDEEIEYGQVVVPLAPGDVVVMYTDGIHETMNVEHELYGSSRLRTIIADGSEDARTLGEAILNDVKRFADGQPQNDDMCLVAFARRREGSGRLE